MRPDDVRRFLREQPFRPFRAWILETTHYDVHHPEQVIVGQSTITVTVPSTDAPIPIGVRQVTIALIHISTIEPLMAPPATSSNGG